MSFSQHARQLCSFDQRINQRLGKARDLRRKITPVERYRKAHHPPVAAGGVFASAHFRSVAVGSSRLRLDIETVREPTGLMSHTCQAQPREVWNLQRSPTHT